MRGGTPLVLGRLGAHRAVIGAALLTTMIAAAVSATLATVGGQMLSRAARHQLVSAAGTAVAVRGNVPAAQLSATGATIRRAVATGLGKTSFTLQNAILSNPLRVSAPVAGPGSEKLAPALASQAGTVADFQAAAMSGIESRALLVTGHWPASSPSGRRVQAALPVAAAAQSHLSTGDVLSLTDVISQRPVRVVITGLFRPRAPAAPYWRLGLIGASGASAVSHFITYGPLVVDPGVFQHAMAVGGGSWVAVPGLSAIPETGLAATGARIAGTLAGLASSNGPSGGLSVSTNLPSVLRATSDSLAVARSLLAIAALQLLLLAGAALAASARLLARQREGELALLAARGGARWQIARISVTEAAPLAVAAAAAGALTSGVLAGVLASSGPMRAAGLRDPGVPGVAWQAVAVVGGLAAVIMLAPLLRPPRPGAVRVARGRQAALSQAAQAGADVALIVLAALGVWQLRRYNAVAPSATGALGVDPVLVVAPTLVLAGGTVAGIRLLPAAARAGERAASRGRWLTSALAVWRLSRRPLRQAGPALLVVLGVAIGTLALSQHASWVRSARDQAAFTAGAQVRVTSTQPFTPRQMAAIGAAAGRSPAMPVTSVAQGSGGEVLAASAREAPGTVLLRRDLSAEPAPSLFSRLTPGPLAGSVLPGRPRRVVFTASLGPAALRLGSVPVTVTVQDADGQTYSLAAGQLPADGHPHQLAASIPPRPVYPVRLLRISMAYTIPARYSPVKAVLTLSGDSGATASRPAVRPGTFRLTGSTLAHWPATASSPELAALLNSNLFRAEGSRPQPVSWQPSRAGGRRFVFGPGYGTASNGTNGERTALPISGLVVLAAPQLRVRTLPGIATRAFLKSNDVTVGSVVQEAFGGTPVQVRIVAAVAEFPTVTGPGGALLVDLPSLQDALVSSGQQPLVVTQWWLASAHPPRGLPPGITVTTRTGVADRLLSNPVSGAPQDVLLIIAVAGAILALAGFGVSVTAAVRERRTESALLSALGVSRAAQVRQLCLEELMLSGPAAVAGLILGAAGALLLVPALTLTPAATTPVPPVRIDLAWPQAVTLAAVVAALPVLAAALTVARRPDPAAQLRAAESG